MLFSIARLILPLESIGPPAFAGDFVGRPITPISSLPE